MTQTRLTIRRTNNIRDIYLNRRYEVVELFPGGRAIIRSKERTRRRAFEKALVAAQPQTSPTAGAGLGEGSAASGGAGSVRERDRPIINRR